MKLLDLCFSFKILEVPNIFVNLLKNTIKPLIVQALEDQTDADLQLDENRFISQSKQVSGVIKIF